MLRGIRAFFRKDFFGKELSFEYRLAAIFFIEVFVLSMLSFTTNAFLGALRSGIVIQGFINISMLVVFFLPLKQKQRIIPLYLLFVVFFYLPFLYFLYAGYDGSSLYFVSTSVFMLAFLYKGLQRFVLVTIDILLYVAAVLLQANVAGVVAPMVVPASRVPDLLAALVFTLFAMFIIARYVNDAYEGERLRNIQLLNELQKKNVDLEEMSVRDSLTGAFNRRYIAEASAQILSRGKREALTACAIMLDIDHFKVVNDTFGHSVGDEVLVQVAQVTQSQLRKSDILARYGGEEFIIMLYPETLDNAVHVAERIRKAVSKITVPDGKNITISAGVVESKQEDSYSMFNRADECLYRAKSNGRNRVEAAER